MNCETNYCDWVSCDDEGDIFIATGLEDQTVTVTVTNKERSEVMDADITDGNLVLPRSSFPEGFFNPYAGEFIVSMGCYHNFCGQYETVTFTIRNGSGKNTIECPCAAQ